MEIAIRKTKVSGQRVQKVPHDQGIYQTRIGDWGIVTGVHAEHGTVDVHLSTKEVVKSIPVISKEWVSVTDKYGSGERDLPPVGARVFVLMPNGTTDNCFVLCSGFDRLDSEQTESFFEKEKETLRKRVAPGNWKTEYDCETGSYQAVSPDEKTSLAIDYGTKDKEKENPELHLHIFEKLSVDIVSEESATITVFGAEWVINKDGEISFKAKKAAVEIDGDISVKATGTLCAESEGDITVKGKNVSVEAQSKATVTATDVTITGGKLAVNGTVTPGTGPFCAVPNCLFTGAPHGGNMVSGT